MAGSLQAHTAGGAQDAGDDASYVIAGTGTSNDGKKVAGTAAIGADGLPIAAPAGSDKAPFVNPAAGAVVALTVPAGTLSSGDNALAVASAVRHIWIENNSGSAIGYAMDAVASAGSRQIPAGSARILDEPCGTAIHIFVGGSTPYNGTVGSNVVVLAWA
jgi:hypothetical protein